MEGFTKFAAKGVGKAFIKNSLKFDMYYYCLFYNKLVYSEYKRISVKKHELHTAKNTKLGLSANDNKCVILDDNVNTLPLGHYSLRNKTYLLQ